MRLAILLRTAYVGARLTRAFLEDSELYRVYRRVYDLRGESDEFFEQGLRGAIVPFFQTS